MIEKREGALYVMDGLADIRFRAWAERYSPGWRGLWRDLPPESFAEVGTRIATVILALRKPAA